MPLALPVQDRVTRLEVNLDQIVQDHRDAKVAWTASQDQVRHELTIISEKLNTFMQTAGRPNYSLLIGVASLTFVAAGGVSTIIATIGGLAMANLRQQMVGVEQQLTSMHAAMDEHIDSQGHPVGIERLESLVRRLEELERARGVPPRGEK